MELPPHLQAVPEDQDSFFDSVQNGLNQELFGSAEVPQSSQTHQPEVLRIDTPSQPPRPSTILPAPQDRSLHPERRSMIANPVPFLPNIGNNALSLPTIANPSSAGDLTMRFLNPNLRGYVGPPRRNAIQASLGNRNSSDRLVWISGTCWKLS